MVKKLVMEWQTERLFVNIFDVWHMNVDECKRVFAKDIKTTLLRQFYYSFYDKLPDHPDENNDFFLFTYHRDFDWVDIHFVCSHFECTTTGYVKKLIKITKKIEKKNFSYTDISYMSGIFEVLILSWLGIYDSSFCKEDFIPKLVKITG